jgi:hypothetical protein
MSVDISAISWLSSQICTVIKKIEYNTLQTHFFKINLSFLLGISFIIHVRAVSLTASCRSFGVLMMRYSMKPWVKFWLMACGSGGGFSPIFFSLSILYQCSILIIHCFWGVWLSWPSSAFTSLVSVSGASFLSQQLSNTWKELYWEWVKFC